ncbi:hypothetical protein Tco_0355197 [Tanacetum coccineum]
MSIPEVTSDSESKCETREPLPPLPKLTGVAPAGTSDSLISLVDLTLNMADLTLNTSIPKKTNPTFKADLSTKQLLLTLMEEEYLKRGRSPYTSYFHMFGCSVHIHNHIDHLGKFDEKADDGFFLADNLESAKIHNNVTNEPISDVRPTPTFLPSTKFILQPPVTQDRWSREKHIELFNIIGEPLVVIITISRVRDLEAASAHECLYINFLSKMEPKKLIEAL